MRACIVKLVFRDTVRIQTLARTTILLQTATDILNALQAAIVAVYLSGLNKQASLVGYSAKLLQAACIFGMRDNPINTYRKVRLQIKLMRCLKPATIEEGQAEDECPICLRLMSHPIQTGCRHRFHGACLMGHVKAGHGSCPMCRSSIF